jgi:hypothetical protein
MPEYPAAVAELLAAAHPVSLGPGIRGCFSKCGRP